MVKKIFIAFLLLNSYVFGQSFEGKITYSNTYESKSSEYSNEQWSSMIGATQEYYIKDGSYKAVTNGQVSKWLLYVNKDNKLYTKLSNSEAVLWSDASLNSTPIVEKIINKNTVEILGYKCDELILKCKSGVQKYYFNSKLKIDISLFENHLFGNWYDYLKQSNSLPLKMIIENSQFILTTTATEVKEEKLESTFFELPEGTNLVKSPY